jgi:hypothetical protein
VTTDRPPSGSRRDPQPLPDIDQSSWTPVATPSTPTLATPPRVFQAIITRFDLRALGPGGQPNDDAWRTARVRLMERFLGRSVRSQTRADFAWWILCDVSCPAHILGRIRQIDPRIRIALQGPPDEPPVAPHLADALPVAGSGIDWMVPPGTDILVTTRFDSDDAMDRRFMEVARERVDLFLGNGTPRFLVVAGAGVQYDARTGVALPLVAPRIAMQTMYERADMAPRFIGASSGNHGKMLYMHPGFADVARNSWLFVIHDHNTSSRLHRITDRIPQAALARDFEVEW